MGLIVLMPVNHAILIAHISQVISGAAVLVFLFFSRPHPPERLSATKAFSVSSSNGCPKCSTVKKSGMRSCCARGGGWFKNCGDVGDTKFDHTWAEGIQACKSK